MHVWKGKSHLLLLQTKALVKTASNLASDQRLRRVAREQYRTVAWWRALIPAAFLLSLKSIQGKLCGPPAT